MAFSQVQVTIATYPTPVRVREVITPETVAIIPGSREIIVVTLVEHSGDIPAVSWGHLGNILPTAGQQERKNT